MKYIFTLFAAVTFCFCFGQGSQRISDFKEGPLNGISEDVRILTTFDNSIVLQEEKDNSRYIYLSDGTLEGTKEILDLGENGWIRTVFSIGDFLYANGSIDSLEDNHLFKISKSDFSVDIVLQGWETISQMQEHDGILYFNGEKTNFDQYFYKYDPASNLAIKIFEVFWFGGITGFGKFKEEFYVLHGVDIDNQMQLSKTTGEAGNKTFLGYFPSGSINRDPLMKAGEDYLFFWARSENNAYSIYSTDGEPGGSKLISDEFEYIPFYDFRRKRSYTTIGNKYLFRGVKKNTSGVKGLFKADGEFGNVVKIKTSNSGEDVEAEPEYFVNYNDVTYVKANLSQFFNTNYTIFETNGFEFGTEEIHEFSQLAEGYYNDGLGMVVFDDKIFHTVYTDDYGRELWSTTGTTASNKLESDVLFGPESSGITALTPSGSNLFFFAKSAEYGRELYVFNNEIVDAKEIVLEQDLNIAPNPSSNRIRVISEHITNQSFVITDMSGQRLKIGALDDGYIEISSLAPGFYTLTVTYGDSTRSANFVKSK